MMRAALVLRPEPAAARTIAGLERRGIKALHWPLFTHRACDWDASDVAADALILTSAAAIRLGGEGLAELRHLPVFAVGAATADAARAAGFVIAATGDSDAAALMPLIAASPHRQLLHLAGESARPLPPVPQAIVRRTVYRAEVRTPDAALATLLDQKPVCLLHSPEAARAFATAVATLGQPAAALSLVVISENAAKAAGEGWAQVAIAREPRDEAMIDQAVALCRHPDREQE